MSTENPEPPGESVLFVCTANLVRSPLAAALFAARLRQAGRTDIAAISAGIQVDADAGATPLPEVTQVATASDLDLSAHQPQQLTRDLLGASALVVTMTEEQRSAATRLVPAVVDRTFTLLELARLLADGEARDHSVAELARRAHRARPRTPPASHPEDIADPIGHPLRQYERVLSQLDQLVHQIGRSLGLDSR